MQSALREHLSTLSRVNSVTFPPYFHFLFTFFLSLADRESSAGIATDYGLDGPGSNPGGDEIFPPVQTGRGAHPASCKTVTESFPWIEAAEAWG